MLPCLAHRQVPVRSSAACSLQTAKPFPVSPDRFHSILFAILAFLLLTATARAQEGNFSATITVKDAALPVTIGLPLPEAADVRDAAQLGVLDPQGAPVPAQMRVLARWRASATETTRPVKWVLVDLKPSVAGAYTITRTTGSAALPPLSVDNATDSVSVTTSRISLLVPGHGNALLKSFSLDGAQQLREPLNIRAAVPRGGLIVRQGESSTTVYLSDASLLSPGDTVRFTHTARLAWNITAGGTKFSADDRNFVAGNTLLLDEGTSREERITLQEASNGLLVSSAPLKFSHSAGGTVRDLTVEQETATIKSISGQMVQFTAPLRQRHALNEFVSPQVAADQALVTAAAAIDRVTVEESNSLRAVVRQDGHFVSASPGIAGQVMPHVSFTIRYIVYADQPFVRVRVRLLNQGTYGFGSWRSQTPPFPQHALLRSLSLIAPAIGQGVGEDYLRNAEQAHARIAAGQGGTMLSAGSLEMSVPEFAENFPKRIAATPEGLHFDLLPDTGGNHIFEGGRAKTTDFYLGRQTIAARSLTTSLNATHDPAWVAASGAVRPVMIERRAWAQVFARDAEMSEAAECAERLMSVAYAVESCEGNTHQPPQSVYEYRLRGEFGEQFGWQNFGDLAWGDGYANLHYDLPFLLLRESLRTGDGRAFQLASEMARYRADWGQYHADDYWDSYRTFNLRGLAFYEKGQHGSYREPVFSHHWVEGLWLHWALTGDEAMHEAAAEASEAIARFNFTYDNALSWNESRIVGWPALAMVVAWRYSGDLSYLLKARDLIYLLVQAEEEQGRKGYFIAPGSNFGPATQPFMWSGYAQLGAIEFWRETGDQRVADFMVRVADWLIGRTHTNPVLQGGRTRADGSYEPLTTPYFWLPDQPGENVAVAQSMLSLPVLSAAARITGRADLRARARQLFRDTAFYRDLAAETRVTAGSRHQINFRSHLFAMSSPKIYGQTGFSLGDYLAEMNDALTLPQTVITLPPPTPVVTPVSPGVVTDVRQKYCLSALTFSGLTNVALHRPATASSFYMWSNATNLPETANDGLMETSDGRVSLWHSASNTKQLEWWQVDLGNPVRIAGLEILFRTENDQSSTRRNFEVRASNDPSFATSTQIAAQGDEPHPFGQAWQAKVTDAGRYRYVRVRKTGIDADEFGETYFNLSEVRVYAQQASGEYSLAGNDTVAVADLSARTVTVGQTLSLALSRTDQCGQPIRHTVHDLPQNASFDSGSGVFRFTPTPAQAGQIFQVTFRSGNAGAEIVTKLDLAVTHSGAPRIQLLTPTGTGRLMKNRQALVTWTTDSATPIAQYQIRLSTDGGATYPVLLAELPGAAQQFAWDLSATPVELHKAAVRLMITAVDAGNRVGIDATDQDLQVAESVAITSAASYRSAEMAAGSICTVWGRSLTSDGGGTAELLPLPQEIRGTQVAITDSRGRIFHAPLFYTSQYQINFFLPEETAPGEAVVTVLASTGEISETSINVTATAPALFTADASGAGETVMLSTVDGLNYQAGAVRQDVNRDVYVVLFGTGWRGASRGAGSPVSVVIDGREVGVLYAGRQPSFAGLDQINFLLPRSLQPGSYALTVKVGAQVSNQTLIRVN